MADEDPAQIGGYRLGAVLGTGGMGRVYLAFTPGGRPVAIKVVRPELGTDDEFRSRFRHEVDAARRVPALYTAQVIDADPAAVPPWVVTGYLPGPSLAQAVNEHGPMLPGTVFLLMAGIAEALEAIHAAGVIHRDLKPSNILLAPDGPRIIDFGIARALAVTMMTKSGAILGSTPFMAPEQAAGQPISGAVDIFALGSLAAYAVTGHLPFGGESDAVVLYRVVHADPDLGGCPEPLRGLIQRCLAKDPAARPRPAEIIASSQAQLANLPSATAQDWLAPGVAAALQEVARSQAAFQEVGGSQGVFEQAARSRAAFQEAAGSQAAFREAPGLQAAVPGSTVPATPPGSIQSPDPLLSALLPPGVPPHLPAGRRTPRSRLQLPLIPRTIALLGLVAAVLIAGTFGVAAAVLSHRGGSRPDKPATGAKAPAKPDRSPGRPSATPSPSISLSAAACLIGRWKGVSENITGTVNNNPVIYTGAGPIETYGADGTATTAYHDSKYSATVNGVRWTQVVNGRATFHYEIQNGLILFSDIQAHGTSTLLENGAYNNGGPFTIVATPERFSCSGNTLREYPSNGSVVSTRAPAHQEGQSTGS